MFKMPKLLKKIIPTIFVSLLLLTFFTTPTHAQENVWYNQGYEEFLGKVFDPDNPNDIFGERYTYAQVTWIIHSITSILTGNFPESCIQGEPLKCFGQISASIGSSVISQDSNIRPVAYGGVISMIGSVGDMTIANPPASGIVYAQDVASRLNLIPEAQAQGIGFQGLNSTILELWKASRNISYTLMVLVVLVMAFMIMFRVKISPQTVVTVQSSLPKIAISLLLITFSFAIAGFMFDLSYVVVGLFAGLIKQSNLTADSVSVQEIFTLLTEGLGGLGAFGFLGLYSLLFFAAALLAVALGAVSFLLGGAVGLGIGLLFLIPAIAMLLITLKVVWMLLKTWVTILLQIIAGPFIILLGVIPGFPGFSGWLKSIAGNLAVFPLTALILMLSNIFFWGSMPAGIAEAANILGGPINPFGIKGGGFRGNVLPPPLLRLPSPSFGPTIDLPLLPEIGVNLGEFSILGMMASFALLFLIPSASNIIKSAIQGRPFEYGAAIAKPIGAAAGIGSYPIRDSVGLIREGRRRKKINDFTKTSGGGEGKAKEA